MCSFCICKSYSHFFSNNACALDIVLTRIVNILTLNELVKLTTLWTTGPWPSKYLWIWMLTRKVQIIAEEHDIFKHFLLHFRENKNWHFMWIICSLIFSKTILKKTKQQKKKRIRLLSTSILLGTLHFNQIVRRQYVSQVFFCCLRKQIRTKVYILVYRTLILHRLQMNQMIKTGLLALEIYVFKSVDDEQWRTETRALLYYKLTL